MQFTQALLLSALSFLSVSALPTPDSSTAASVIQKRDWCQNPGDHTCAVITSSSLSSVGLAITYPGSLVGDTGVAVVGGGCDNIIASGELKTNSPGFSADFKLTYGGDLYYGANWIGLDNTGGIRFQYNGNSYTQDECFTINGDSGVSAGEAIQCNFPC